MHHRKDVQSLRAIAIAAVLFFHFFPEVFPNGYLGVDVFFVISGYLILMILSQNAADSQLDAGTVLFFYYRRVKRILPLHYLYCLIAISLFTIFASPVLIKESVRSATAALCFLTNVRALFQKEDYFTKIMEEDLFTHIWSLSVEIQFYFMVPFLFLMRQATGGYLAPIYLPIVSVLSILLYLESPALIGFNVVLARLWQVNQDSAVFELLNGKSDELVEKQCLIETEEEEVKSSESIQRRWINSNEIIYLFALSLLIFICFCMRSLPPVTARIAVTGAASLLIALGENVKSSRLLGLSPLEFLGDVSYSLYLIHWPLSVYLVKTTEVSSLIRLSTIPFALAITIIVYHVFEKHYRNWSQKQIGWCCSLLLLLNTSALMGAYQLNYIIHAGNATKFNITQKSGIDLLIIPECSYSFFRNLSGPEHQVDVAKPLGMCDLPPGKGKLNFAVIGNSFAANQGDFVWKHFKPFFNTCTLFSQVACEVFTETVWPDCKRLVNYSDVLDDLKPDVTFIIQRYGRPKEAPPLAGKPDLAYEEMVEHLRKIENKTHLFFVMDTFPAVRYEEMIKLIDMIEANLTPREINDRTVLYDEDVFGRPRTKKLMKECKNCIWYDVEPGLTDEEGKFMSYDGRAHLATLEPGGHVTPHGRSLIEPIYKELARQYEKKLRDLEQELYG